MMSTDVNWRVVKGYGALISAHAKDVPVVLDCPVSAIDHRGKRLRITTAKGEIAADQVIVTVPSTILAAERISFTPALPEKIEAACGLPLGLADKLFMSLDGAEEFETSVRLFARTDRTGTAGYHFRPFGRPMIEAYFGGTKAAALEKGGEDAFFDFAVSELTHVFGQRFCPPPQADQHSSVAAAIRSRWDLILMLCRVSPIAGRHLPSRSTSACSLPARRARRTTSPPRMAVTRPVSPQPTR